ncbi:MAG TPA: ester cyclase [Aldersonia sp.]
MRPNPQVSDPLQRHKSPYEVGDTIIVEGVYSGTHNGPLVTPDGTVPPTGRTFEFSYADILQAREGKFVSHRIYWDTSPSSASSG